MPVGDVGEEGQRDVPLVGRRPPQPLAGVLARGEELAEVLDRTLRRDQGHEHPHGPEPIAVGQTAPMADEHVDYRFLLANERTFLAYVRTALALQIAGLGVLQFLTHGHGAVRNGLGVALVATGSYVGLIGFVRFRSVERAIRAGTEMHSLRASPAVTLAVALVPLVAAILLAVL